MSLLLERLFERFKERAAGDYRFELRGVTQQDMADLIGASRSFVSTLVNDMKRDGEFATVGRALRRAD